jgi:hypothetical protein
MKQVFWNLARNALQAMPDGGTLKATLHKNSNNRLHISLAIRDAVCRQTSGTFVRTLFINDGRHWSRSINCLSDHPRPWWYNQRAES